MNRPSPLLIALIVAAVVLIASRLAGGPHVRPPGLTLDIAGRARVVDGDTLELGGHHVRLFGIDAPESHQTCERDGLAYACGEAARRYLEQLVAGQPVACRAHGADRYGRAIAVCNVGTLEINAAMVRAGWAIAYRQYSTAYVELEDEARSRRSGIWAGHFEPPAAFRQQHPS